MKVSAFSFNQPICAGIISSVQNRILTIENVILWRSDDIFKIAEDLDALKRLILIHESPVQKELRQAYKVIKINENAVELTKDTYTELVKENRLIEKKICDVSVPYVWNSMVILLSGVSVQLSKNYSIATSEIGKINKIEGLISLVNGNDDEFEPDDPMFVDRQRYIPPWWFH